MVDTLGLILVAVVHAANVQDRVAARSVLDRLKGRFTRLKVIWADGGYTGELVGWVRRTLGCLLSIVHRQVKAKGFIVLPKRWLVERTFGWLSRYRRLDKDHETLTNSSEAMVHLAMINLMVHRLEPG